MVFNWKNRVLLISILVILLCLFVQTDLWAQCPMCRMSAENNLKQGGTAGKGLNAAILFLLATPYVVVGTLGYIYWKYRKKSTADQNGQQ